MKKNTKNDTKRSPNTKIVPRDKRSYDLIVYGATGYTGELICSYLLEKYGFNRQEDPIRWAIAGRNRTKLELLRERLEKAAKKLYRSAPTKDGAEGEDANPSDATSRGRTSQKNRRRKDSLPGSITIITADSSNAEELNQMVRQTRVIISTVGPYMKFGIPLVKECVENRTDYVDLTGEVPFIRDSIERFHETAMANDTRIIHACAFDALPSDIGVMTLQDFVIARTKEPADEILTVVLEASGGGVSIGTASTISNLFDWASGDPKRRAMLLNPYALNDSSEGLPRQKDLNAPHFDAVLKRWLSPFLMSSFNTRVVRRSNELMRNYYGREFIYQEAMAAPSLVPKSLRGRLAHLPSFLEPVNRVAEGVSAGLTSLSLGGLFLLMSYGPARDAIRNLYMYMARNPSLENRREGSLKMLFSARRDGKEIARTVITSDKDPGYGASAIMIAESALCLALERERLRGLGGVLTPAAGLREVVRVRLEATGHFKFETEYVADRSDERSQS